LEQGDDAEDITQYGIKVYFPLDEEEFNNVLNEQFGYPMTN
jgi:hypothetical protein